MYPLHPESASDMALINNVLESLGDLHTTRDGLLANEKAHMQLLEDFVADLGHLAKCAIEKAKRESKDLLPLPNG